jgi:hypothetical protein
MINAEQVKNAVKNGEFESEVIKSKGKVVLIMTQDWCPQWHDLRSWVYNVDSYNDIDIYELEYNKVDYGEELQNLKENQWDNSNLPYLRFYKNGKLVKETNYISKQEFIKIVTE